MTLNDAERWVTAERLISDAIALLHQAHAVVYEVVEDHLSEGKPLTHLQSHLRKGKTLAHIDSSRQLANIALLALPSAVAHNTMYEAGKKTVPEAMSCM